MHICGHINGKEHLPDIKEDGFGERQNRCDDIKRIPCLFGKADFIGSNSDISQSGNQIQHHTGDEFSDSLPLEFGYKDQVISHQNHRQRHGHFFGDQGKTEKDNAAPKKPESSFIFGVWVPGRWIHKAFLDCNAIGELHIKVQGPEKEYSANCVGSTGNPRDRFRVDRVGRKQQGRNKRNKVFLFEYPGKDEEDQNTIEDMIDDIVDVVAGGVGSVKLPIQGIGNGYQGSVISVFSGVV